MRKSEIVDEFTSDIQKVWNIVTNNEDYKWRSDLERIEISDKGRTFIEYTKNGFQTKFIITKKIECSRYEFKMENSGFKGSIGVSTGDIRKLARKLGKSQELAEQLWETKYHEAKILSVLLMDEKTIVKEDIERLMIDVKSWDLCDHICKNLIVKLDDDYAPGELYGEDTTELNSKITKIDELFDANDSCEYEYDFGDSWEHEIIIEKRLKGY